MKKLFSLVLVLFAMSEIMSATSSNNYLLDSIVRVDESTGFVDSKKIYEYHANGTMRILVNLRASWSSWKVGIPKILNSKTALVYDEEGNEIDYYTSKLDTATGIWKDTHSYLYDERHNRVCGVRKWNEDSTVVLQGSHYFYDEDNFQIGSDQFDTWNGVQVLDYKCENTKDAHGNKIIMVEYSKPESAWEGDYMSDPNAFNAAGWVPSDSVFYTYNEKQEKMQETIYRWDNENQEWTLDGYQIFEYDAEGHCIADTVFARDFETNVITYNNMTAYIYDSHGQLSRIQMFMPNFTENGVEWLENGMYAYDYTYDENGEILQLRDYIDWQNNTSSITYYTSTYYYSEHPIQDDPEPSCLFASGTCGGDLTWELTCDSVLTIKGTGMMYEYSDWNSPWRPYKDSIKSVIIEEGVTTISTAAFRDHGHLQSCILPSTIESIGNEAFCFCFQLMYIEIPPSCTSFGDGSFNLVPNVIIQGESLLPYSGSARSINGYVEGYFVYADKSKRSLRACSSIAKGYVALDDAIERIEYMAFAQCEEITNLQFGSHLQYIGEWSLNGCIGLEGLRFQEGLKEIASNAFGNCFGLQYVYLPNSLTTLGDFAIGNCPVLRTIHLGDSLRNVGSQIFDSCQGIDTIYATMTTPPVLDNTAFAASNLPGITCYVPSESLSLYHQAPVWSSMNLKAIGSFDPEPCLIASGTCGDNLTWELSCDSVLTISGTGAMTSAPWIKSYKTAIKNAIIEDGVTNIYGYAFYYCSNLESVTIGNGVTQIEEYAFYKCTALESVQLPKNIQSIGNYAYAYCSSLTSIALPNSVTTMGDEVFCMCTSLASASLSENLTKISMGTFDGCTALSSIIVPEGVKTIEARAFYQCKSLVSIELPSTVTFIDGVAFSLPISFETALKTFTCHAILPPSLGNNVFEYLEPGANLIRLYVPGASLEAYKAADQWKEFEIILPIPGTEPCESNNTVRAISVCSGYWFNDEWLEQSGIYHDTLLNHLGCDSIIELHLTIHSSYGGGVPSELMDTITIERGESIVISNGITIYPSETGYQNDTMRTIYGCDSIVTHYIIVTEPTCLIASGTCGNSITWELSCEGVLTISGNGEMPNWSSPQNGPWYEYREDITSIFIGNGVTSIGEGAFYECSGLTSVTIPSSVTSIGRFAFYYCSSLTSVTIPNSVTSIEYEAFSWCTGLMSVTLPNSVTTIGEGAFYNCSGLTSVTIPYSVTSIGSLAFYNCSGLMSVTIPNSVTTIGEFAFANCSGLTCVTCEAVTPPTLGERYDTFYGVNKTIPLYVPGPSIDLYKAADQWKDFMNILPIPGTEVVEYPVIFLDYNSDVLSEQSVAEGSAAVAPHVPAREGYTFSGWSADIEHIVARTFAIALYDKIGGTLTYLSEEGDVIATENVDLHLPAAPIIAGKSFKGWLTESADSENGIVLRATYTFDNPTTHDDVTITPSSNSAYVIFPFITGALTYQLVIRDLFGNVVCKIMFSATGHLLGIAFAPSRNRESQQATQTTGFNFTVEGLDANTTYEYEFVANDDTDEVIETLSGSFTTTAEVPTDNEQVNSPSAVRKYLEDGHLMIDANSHIFNTQGKMIK